MKCTTCWNNITLNFVVSLFKNLCVFEVDGKTSQRSVTDESISRDLASMVFSVPWENGTASQNLVRRAGFGDQDLLWFLNWMYRRQGMLPGSCLLMNALGSWNEVC